jgi:hypothetical protein
MIGIVICDACCNFTVGDRGLADSRTNWAACARVKPASTSASDSNGMLDAGAQDRDFSCLGKNRKISCYFEWGQRGFVMSVEALGFAARQLKPCLSCL